MPISDWISNLHVEISGPAEADPVLLLHGWGSNAGLMRPLAEAFQQHYLIYNIDLPGHGTTPPPPEAWGIPEHAELLDAYLREQVGRPVHVIGHSNGGRLSLYMAGDPATAHHFRTLALISPSGVKARRTIKYYIRRGLATALKAPFVKLPAPMREYGLDWVRHTLVWRMLGSADYSRLHGVMRDVFVKTVNCYVEDRLAQITVPTLLFRGTNDDAISRYQMDIMQRGIPDCALIELESASHYGYLDQPEVVISSIRKFLSVGVRGPGALSTELGERGEA